MGYTFLSRADARGKHAATYRRRTATTEERAAARRDLAAANIAAAIEREVAVIGPLGDEIADALDALTRGGAR